MALCGLNFFLTGVTIGFNPENYTVNEGGDVTLMIKVLSGTLQREVEVRLTTNEGGTRCIMYIHALSNV